MNRTEFVEQYAVLMKQVLALAEKARREGLLSLNSNCDPEKVSERSILEYGLSFVIDGTDASLIEKILSNIIAQEKDEYTRIYKTIQKEAVLEIQQGLNPRMLYFILNSLTDISLKDDEAYINMNADEARERDKNFDKEMSVMLQALDEQMGIKPKNEADKDQGFTFDDIILLDDRCVQYLLRRTDPHDLAVALKTASQAVQGKIFKNVSRNAAVMLKEEMDYMGAVSENDAQEARQKIIGIIMRLEETGEIIVSRREAQ